MEFFDNDGEIITGENFYIDLKKSPKTSTSENAVVSAEIKIEITGNSIEEIFKQIQKICDVCKTDYKLKLNVEGNFFKA